jgi:hypothetical protein
LPEAEHVFKRRVGQQQEPENFVHSPIQSLRPSGTPDAATRDRFPGLALDRTGGA